MIALVLLYHIAKKDIYSVSDLGPTYYPCKWLNFIEIKLVNQNLVTTKQREKHMFMELSGGQGSERRDNKAYE